MLSPPFRISKASLTNLLADSYRMRVPEPPIPPTWTGTPHVVMEFLGFPLQAMAILLGRCESCFEDTESMRTSGRLGQHWTAVVIYDSKDGSRVDFKSYEHACPGDHVGPDSAIQVEDPHLRLSRWDPLGTTNRWRLTFTRCRVSPDTTLIINVERLKVHVRRALSRHGY